MNKINEIIDSLTIVRLLWLAFGAYSVTRLITTDTFPLFANIRERIFRRFPPDGYVFPDGDPRIEGIKVRRTAGLTHVVEEGHWFGELISCPWCAGWWVSLGVVIAYVFVPEITLIVLLPFALRAFVGGFAAKVGG